MGSGQQKCGADYLLTEGSIKKTMQQKWEGCGHEPVMHHRALYQGTHFFLLKTQSDFFTFPEMVESTSSSIGEEKFPVSSAGYVPCLYNVLTQLLSHRKKLHYNLVAPAMQYIPIPSPCPMNMKYIWKHNSINRQYWELPIHQCSTRQCLACSLGQILQR